MAGKKILLIDQFNKIGGGQTVLIDLVKSFQQLNLDCTVAVPRGGYIESQIPDVKFRYLSKLDLNNSKKSIKDVFTLLYHFLRESKIITAVKNNDIIYVNGPRYYFLFYLFSYFIKRKYIYHIHLEFSKPGKRLIQLLSKQQNTSAIIFTSHYLMTEYLKEIEVDDKVELKKLIVIEPGVSDKYDKQELRVPVPKADRKYNFLSAGRIDPEKGFNIIIDIARFYKECNFYIIGEPETVSLGYFDDLKGKAGTNVHFLGRSNNIPQLIIDCDIDFGIVPSICNEAFGIVAIELMLCSCITLVSNRGGLVDIANKTGAIIFNDTDELVEKINLLINHSDETLNELRRAEFENTKFVFGQNTFYKNVNALISRLLN